MPGRSGQVISRRAVVSGFVVTGARERRWGGYSAQALLSGQPVPDDWPAVRAARLLQRRQAFRRVCGWFAEVRDAGDVGLALVVMDIGDTPVLQQLPRLGLVGEIQRIQHVAQDRIWLYPQ